MTIISNNNWNIEFFQQPEVNEINFLIVVLNFLLGKLNRYIQEYSIQTLELF